MKHLCPDLLLTSSTYLCKDCYNPALEFGRSTDNEFTTNVVDKDEDFLPNIPECIKEFNYEISTFFLSSVSSLKRKNLIRKKSIENYVKKKKKKILSTLSNIFDVKLNNMYEVSIIANESTICR